MLVCIDYLLCLKEPDKMYFQQKTLKEQEQERAWKQHQAKNKEAFTNKSIINKTSEYYLKENVLNILICRLYLTN